MKHMMSGVSTRNYDPLLDEISGGTGLKKSSVSKAFVRASREALDELNGRDLGGDNYVAIMMDGIGFGKMTVIVALGIDIKGQKHILGLRQGETENWEICRDLIMSLADRGLDVEANYLFVIDGSKALKKAIKKVFGKRAKIQRCIRHKERNIIQYLPKEHHAEFRRKWKLLNGSADYGQAKREYDRLVHWLGHVNHSALSSLEESEMETLTVIEMGLPRLLRTTMSSTNPIESAFSMGKPKVRRVKNWKSGPDQIVRWSASVLLEAEKKFRTIRGYKQIPYLINELKKLDIENQAEVA
jgi:putative transposase